MAHPPSEPCAKEAFRLGRLETFEENTPRGFRLTGEPRDTLFVIRRGDALRAYLNQCPHQGASLPWQKNAYLNAAGTRIVCSAHGAQFDPDSGHCLAGPALGNALVAVDLEIDREGWVWATIDRTQ